MPWVCGGIRFPCIDTLRHSSHGHLEASQPLSLAVTVAVNRGHLCLELALLTQALAYGREGGEYNTPSRGNKPACLSQVVNLPLTSGLSQAFC
ncbi:hypothetical protein PsAD13_01473 [Pseudovibrio sp. Ad13]|nr:hypothetical protein PsAD13_01473 [Pseudovibrio sp. Ad13]